MEIAERKLSSDRSKDVSPVLGASIAILTSSLLYGVTLAPTILWGDDARLQLAAAKGSLTSYPLWGLLARVFAQLPWGDLAFRANLASAVYAVGAIVFLFLVILALSQSTPAALCGSLAMSASHSFWLHAVRAEVYTLHMVLFFAGLWAFLRWRSSGARWIWLAIGLALWIVGAVNHLLLVLAFPGGLFLLMGGASRPARRSVLLWLALVLVTGTLLVASFVPSFFGTVIPQAARTVLGSLAFSPRQAIKDLALLTYQFPFLGAFAGPGYLYLWRRDRGAALALGLMALFTAVFAATFDVPDAYVFYLPAYGLVAIGCGLGAATLTARWPWPRWLLLGATLVGLQIGLYRLTPVVLDRLAPNLIYARDLPGRPANTFFLWPSKRGYTGARWFAETALDLLPPNALLMVDWTPMMPIKYLQEVEGRRRDVGLVYADAQGIRVFDKAKGRRPLFLANADPRYYPTAELSEFFDLEAVGPIYRLVQQPDGP